MCINKDEPRDALERALVGIDGATECLFLISEGMSDQEANAVAYLTHQISQHRRAAFDAFCRIFELEGGR